ncbi:CDP-alcohol phosphatidyltransferase family protein [Halorientalis halophila]|uniref:CDP-alcohol phosphatidyltransferase family protein n=1 Tax=Halorientalis halophila TaxID=3108499 RepID=UPI0030095CB3
MADEKNHVRAAVRDVRRRVDRRKPSGDEEYLLFRLGIADYISLVALFFGWTATILVVSGEPNWALVTMLVAFAFDKLDGFYARTFGEPTTMGRHIDAFIDVFTYLVPAVALYHFVLSPHTSLSVVVGFVVLAFGLLRLVRFASEGLEDDDGTSYYRGITVVHVNVLVVANYFLAAFVGFWNGWLAAASILLAAPLMISNYRSYKTASSHTVVALLALLLVGLALVLEFGLGF